MVNKECKTEIDVSFELPSKLTLPCSALAGGINYEDIITLSVGLTADEYNRYEIELPVDENYAYMLFGTIHFNGYSEKNVLKIIFEPKAADNNVGGENNQGIGGLGNSLWAFTLHAEEKQENDQYYRYNDEPVILPTMLLYTNKLILNPGGYELLHGRDGPGTPAGVNLYGYVIRIKRPQSVI